MKTQTIKTENEISETEMYQEIISFIEEADSINIMRNMFLEFLDNRNIQDLYRNYQAYILSK